ncbi:hypothetical protein HMPREF1550_02089 [Actinomyces sp. oral taxon 877 str. F0543]|nr:hypothetical protein HMPREF1550_02089 [Actinomyces sp. oral taxon 877 str. F0543]
MVGTPSGRARGRRGRRSGRPSPLAPTKAAGVVTAPADADARCRRSAWDIGTDALC